MGSRIVGALALVTFLHVGARVAAPATSYRVSALEAGPAPELVSELTPAAASSSCQLWVAFDPECPACAKAVQAQKLQSEVLPLDVVWVGETDQAVQSYLPRVHPDAHLVASEDFRSEMKVRAVPAAFLISEGEVVYSTVLTGSEDLNMVSEACVAA